MNDNADATHEGHCPYEESAERRVMMGVIANAVLDACGKCPTVHERERSKLEAMKWFEEAGPDFEAVCELAGFHPATVRRYSLAYIASHQHTGRNGLAASYRSIAAKCGLKQWTVMRVLSEPDKYPPATIRRVNDALRELTEEKEAA